MITIVMYHFVRARDPVFAQLPVLEPAAFAGQLRYLQRHYTLVSLAEAVDAIQASSPMPDRAAVLTFDDGYSDHFATVFPLLAEARVPATFFPVRSALVDRRVLEVNKVQLILASGADPHEIGVDIDRRLPPSTIAAYRQRWHLRSRFDPADVMYVKHMLQHAMPGHLREALVDEWFRRKVTKDEADIADQLYLTIGNAREMIAGGMTFGAHADRHVPLTSLDRDGQAREIDGALAALDAIGASRDRFLYSYAKGEHDAASLELLKARGCKGAVATRPDVARRGDDPLALPRLATNDLPTDAEAPPSAWTNLVSG